MGLIIMSTRARLQPCHPTLHTLPAQHRSWAPSHQRGTDCCPLPCSLVASTPGRLSASDASPLSGPDLQLL